MGNKTLDMQVRAALLVRSWLDIDSLRGTVGKKYTDGELRASLYRVGARSVEVDGEIFWNFPE